MNNENLFEIKPLINSTLKNLSKDGIDIIIEKNVDDKIIAIYDTNMYPLLTARKNEYFIIYFDKNIFGIPNNYILKYYLNSLIAIYEDKGNKLFEITNMQYAEITSGIKDFSTYPYITIYSENNKTTIFDVGCNETIYESHYINSKLEVIFETPNDLILEKVNEKIKVISQFKGAKLVSSENSYFELISSFSLLLSNNLFIKEIFTDKKLVNVYIFQKTKLNNFAFYNIHSSKNCDLSIELLSYELMQDTILILGNYNNKIKEISLYNISKNEILATKKIPLTSEKYFELYKNDSYHLFNVMHNNKCIKILNENLEILCSTIYRKGNITSIYFEFELIYRNLYIKKIKDGKCIEVCSLNPYYELKKLSKTKEFDIKICQCEHYKICFLHMKDDKCIAVENTNNKLTGLTYETYKNELDKLIAIYGIKDGKKVAIYDYNLDCKVDCKDTDNSVFIYNIYFDYRYADDYCWNYFPIINYLLYDKNDNIIGLYINDKTLLESNEKESYKLVDNKFILKYKYNKCISIYYFSAVGNFEEFSRHIKFSHLCLHTENKSFLPIVEEYNLKTNENSLYVFDANSFFKIAENYENYYTLDNFLILQDMQNIWKICKTTSNFRCKLICQIILTDDRTLKFNSISSQHYITEKINETIVTVFKITDNNIIKILENPNGIKEIISSNNQVFFEMDGKIYNFLGNEINSLTEHIED